MELLPNKLTSRIEVIEWLTGNQGTLRFFIKLPDLSEEVDPVKMLGTQEKILACIPKYALQKSTAHARELFHSLKRYRYATSEK